MPRAFNYERAACALVDAILMGDRAAAEKYEVTYRSIQEWRARLSTDPKLVQLFQEKKQIQDAAWGDEIPNAIASGIKFLTRAAQECKPDDPDAVHAIAGYIKILSEISMTRKVIDARLAGKDRSNAQEA
ncbi:MAG: hypothetical protein AAFR31_21855 [Cyanobacteria bacterium J06627_8]